MRSNLGTPITLGVLTALWIAALLPAAYHLLNFAIIYNGNSTIMMSRMVLSVSNQYQPLQPDYSSEDWDLEFHRFVDLFFEHIIAWCAVVFALQIGLLVALAMQAEFLLLLLTVFLAIATVAQLGLLIFRITQPDAWNKNYEPYLKHLQENFEGTGSSTFTTIMLSYLQHEKSCCGIESYEEWSNPRFQWNKIVEYSGVQYELRVPLSCCRGLAANIIPDCALSSDTQYIFTRGCLGRVDPLLAYMPSKQFQELLIVFIVFQTASIIVFIAYRCMEHKQLQKYLKKGDLGAISMPSITAPPRGRKGTSDQLEA